MTLLAPLAGLAALAVPAILLLYFLKVRRPESDFSSTLLWRRAVLDRQANAPWQRLRGSWLLALQLLAVLLLVGALVRPALALPSALGAHTILVVDSSATMQATDVVPSRFEEARRQARAILDAAAPGQRVTLVQMGNTARVLASARGDMGPIRTVLAGIRPDNGRANLAEALALAAASGTAAGGSRVIVLSDGITLPLPAATNLPFPFEYRRIGTSGENLAVTTLSLHPEPASRGATARLQNLGRLRGHADVEWRVDGRLVDARAVDLEGGGLRDLSFSLPAGAARVEVRIRNHDALALDDVAYGVATLPRSQHVTLVTAANIFVQRALELRPDLSVRVIKPADYRFEGSVDLYVFDGFVPAVAPPTPSWYINPPVGQFGAGQAASVGRPRASNANDPLLRDVDLREVHVARAVDLRHTSFGGRSVLETDAGPLVMVRDEPTRAVLFGFDIHASDLPLRTAFPVLVDHLGSDLLPPSVGPRAYRPDEAVLLPVTPGDGTIDVTRPDGHVDHLGTAAAQGLVAFSDTDQAGLYSVTQRTPAGAASSTFAVNAGGEVSAVAPRERLQGVSGHPAAATSAARGDFRELWPWLVLAALVVLSAEWVVFHRGR